MRLASLTRTLLVPTLSMAALLIHIAPSRAAVVVYNDGGVYTVNSNVVPDSYEVRTTSTLNVEAGASVGTTAGSSISTFDSAILNMSGGVLTDELFMYNSSTATISGGQIVDDITTTDNAVANVSFVIVDDDVEAGGNSVINISGGEFNEDVESFDNATVNISDGLFQTGTNDGANIEAGGSSVINIHGGAFGTAQANGMGDGAGYIGAIETGTVNIYGGDISGQPECLVTEAGGKINVYGFAGGQPAAINTAAGGTISFFDGPLSNLVANDPGVRLLGTDGSLASIVAEDSSVITIYGSGFKAFNGAINLPYGPISFAASNLTGVLSDGTPITNVPFTRNLLSGGVRGVIVLAPSVPEPGSIAMGLLGLVGAGLIRRRQSR